MLADGAGAKSVFRFVLPVIAVLILLGSLGGTGASAYCSLTVEAQATVSSPGIVLQSGTAGTSTIYTNSTSAKAGVASTRANETEDYVDLLSNVDNSTDIGTHSNFTAQQNYDGSFDTLTEVNIPALTTYQIHPTAFEDSSSAWQNEANTWDWNNATSAINTKKIDDFLHLLTWNNTGQGTITQVDLRVRLDLTGLVSDYLTISWYVGVTQGIGTYEVNSTNQGTDIVVPFDEVTEPINGTWEWTDIGNLEIQLLGTQVSKDTITYAVDEVWGWVSASTPNYELDLEVKWTNVDFDEPNEELCIYCGTMGAESIILDAWNGTAWNDVLTDLSSGWNNVSVSTYLTSANFTIRFKGSNETGDATQDGWNIDATLLYLFTSVETTYDYVLRVNNTLTDSWEIRLKEYSDSGISRLDNCTIYLRNSTNANSTQITVDNGSFNQTEGTWYSLDDSETINIVMTVKANSTGTSYIRVYFEARIPSTTTYLQYIVTFEIT